MWKYIILITIWIGFVFHWILGSIPNHRLFEVFAGLCIGLYLTILDFGIFGWFATENNHWFLEALSVLGNVLTVIAFALVLMSLLTLARRGKPKNRIERTTVFIDLGIFRFVRPPLYLGGAIWSIALILQTKLPISAVWGVMAFFCFLCASVKEDDFNKNKFGESYKRYMAAVPMWNLFKKLLK